MVDMKQPITKNKINIKIRYDLQDTEYRTCSVQVCKCANDTDSYEVVMR